MNWIGVEVRLSKHVAQKVGCKQVDRNLGAPRWQDTSWYPVSEKKEDGLAGVPQVQKLSQHKTIHGGGRRKGRRGRKKGMAAYPYRRYAIHHGLPTRTTTSTCGSGDFRVLRGHADDVNGGGCCGFAGAGYTSSLSVRNLDIDKVGAANSLIGAVMAIVVERIKVFKTRVTSSGPSINERAT